MNSDFEDVFNTPPLPSNGILKFNVSQETTKVITDFYDEAPFPNYKDKENKEALVKSGDNNQFSMKLKKFIGNNKSVVEIGSGTTQLSNYLAIGTNSQIFALDATEKSLRLGYEFAENNNINNITFVNADIFDDVFKDSSFDIVWCSGVLHHTSDPYKGFQIISKYLKPNGYIFIGLYNKYGRFRTQFRQILYKVFGEWVVELLDPVLRNMGPNSEEKRRAWIRDQYIHPVESTHSFDEVLDWFEKNNIEFVSSIPSCEIGGQLDNQIFKSTTPETKYERIWQQIFMIFSKLGGEGGLFIFIGKKNE